MSDNPDSSGETKPEDAKKQKSGRVHPISIDALIVHKYSGSEALLQKADKIARDIITEELRIGEFFRAVRPGRYHLHLPKLLPEAGQLRASVISDRIFRAIRQFNPTAIQIREKEESVLDPPPLKLGTSDADHTAEPALKRAVRTESDEEAEMRKLASQALSMMASEAASAEELVSSAVGRLLQTDLEVKRLPVWNVKSQLISAYECVAVRQGALVLKDETAFAHLGVEMAEVKAVIDILVYKIVGAMLRQNLQEQRKVLLLCPVHASTLEHTRYVSAYLGAGSDIPASAQKFLVFLVKDFKKPISRLKLRDLSSYLRTRCLGLVADVPLDTEVVSFFKEFGFHGVRASAAFKGTPETRLLKALDAFAERCEKAKLESFIGDLRTNSAAVAALASGCTYLSGSVIAKRSKVSGAAAVFELDSLFTTSR